MTEPKRMKSREIRDNWRETLRHVEDGGEVIVIHYQRPIARIVPIQIEEPAVHPTLTVDLPRMTVPRVDEWEALPVGEQRTQAARDAAATYDTIATATRRLARQYYAVSEAIAEVDVMGDTSPEAAKVLATWPHEVPSDPTERERLSRLLEDMAQGMRGQATAADREADNWRARIDELFGGMAAAY